MNIKILKIEEYEVEFERLRNAPLELAGNEVIYEYKESNIGLCNLDTVDVAPTTFYALRKNLSFQEILRESLVENHKIDIFDLPGIMYLEVYNKTIGLVPPFVEVYKEENGETVWALQDGIHRFLLAKEMGLKQKCIVINSTETNCQYLPYAYPNSWGEVVLGENVPKIKKNYRRQIPYSYMRPLRSIFDQKILSGWSDYGRR